MENQSLIWNTYMDIIKTIQSCNGYVFGNYIIDYLSFNKNKQEFYKKYSTFFNVTTMYKDDTFDKTTIDRLITPSEISCFMSSNSMKFFINNQLKKNLYIAENITNVSIDNYDYFNKDKYSNINITKIIVKFKVADIIQKHIDNILFKIPIYILHHENKNFNIGSHISMLNQYNTDFILLTPQNNFIYYNILLDPISNMLMLNNSLEDIYKKNYKLNNLSLSNFCINKAKNILNKENNTIQINTYKISKKNNNSMCDYCKIKNEYIIGNNVIGCTTCLKFSCSICFMKKINNDEILFNCTNCKTYNFFSLKEKEFLKTILMC